MQTDGQIRVVPQKDWDAYLRQSRVPVFVEFWAPWCGPCHTMAPLITELATEYDARVSFVKVNVDESPELVAKFQIFSVPTFIIFVNGQPVKRFVGMATKDYMASMLKWSMQGERS